MKKKILFLITDLSIFTGFFKSDIRYIAKNYDVFFLIYKYGFHNKNFRRDQLNWFNNLEKNKIIKKVIWLDEISYTNFYKNIIFNKKFIKVINKIKTLNIDYFFIPTFFHYWVEIFFQIFKNKNTFGYLINAPSGLDFFNNFKDLNKSLKLKKIFKKFSVKSDNSDNHLLNTRPLNNNFFIFIYQKINIALSKSVNHYLLPVFLIKRVINIKSIYYKLNLKFFDFEKIIIFNTEFKNFLENFKLKNNAKVFLCSKYNPGKKSKNYNWIYTYASSKDKKVLSKLFNYLIILKRLKKLNCIYFKGHPTWKYDQIEKNFFKKLSQIGIKYKFIESYKKINYLKYYGLISAPSTVLLESSYNNPDIKIIGIKRNKNLSSGLLYKFYRSNKKGIIWEPKIGELKNYLAKNKKDTLTRNNLKNILL